MATLTIKVGEPMDATLARAAETMAALDAGREVDPYFGISFDTMAQFGAVFTPKRWELVEAVRASSPLTLDALAQRLGRHRNVRKDVEVMMEWMVIEKDEAGRFFVPWDEIDVRWPLMKRAA
ncbi:MAG: hypothetical protein EPN14_00530 [Gallionella sp.]|nr:MAG: hypothetical protein EPN14_00530 [Gallionella sp.]